jgi:GT2 family glycosyltransferase
MALNRANENRGIDVGNGKGSGYPLAALIILTWNRRKLTLECLDSVADLDYPADRLRIVVVDNGSDDGTSQHVQSRYPAVTLLRNRENLGYAGGNNVGIRWALAQGVEYIGILNNDVNLAPDFLVPLLAALEKDAKAGAVTPLVADMANPDKVWALGAAVNGRTATVARQHSGERAADWRVAEPFEVDVASGTALLARRQVFEKAGLLDEAFYLYYEEVEWCLRLRQAGYRILAVPSSVVWHKVSATLGPTSPAIDYYMLRNHLRLIGCHWSGVGRLWPWTRTVLRNLATIAAYTAKPCRGGRLPHRNARLLALRDALLGRWGKMGPDVQTVCAPGNR